MSRLLGWVILCGVMLLAAGCGGSSGGDTSSGSAGGGEALSKSEWIDQADAICTTEQEEEEPLEAELEEVSEGSESSAQLKKVADLTRELLALVETETASIRELTPPASDTETIDAMLVKVEGAVPLGEGFAEAVESGDVAEIERSTQQLEKNSASAKAMAKSYGLEVCGSDE